MCPRVSLLNIGNELLNGRTADTNSHFLTAYLSSLGFDVQRISVLKDSKSQMSEAISSAAGDSNLLITTGGLGPTSDDFTRDVLAEVCGAPLERRAASLEKLQRISASKGRELYENGATQADFPKGAIVIDNPLGTADAFVCRLNDIPIVALPGVPGEMKELMKSPIKEFLLNEFPNLKNTHVKYLRLFGLSESYIGKSVDGLGLEEDLTIAFRPTFPEVMISVSGASASDVGAAINRISQELGEEFIFSAQAEERLVENLVKKLVKEKKTLAVAESCTGGLIASNLVSVPGVSEVFISGITAYANSAKEKFLSVSSETLEQHGAVSEAVALELATNVREKSSADFGISTTGVAGPSGGSDEKPTGSVWIGLSTADDNLAFHYNLPYSREGFRRMAATLALDKLRRKLLGLSLTWQLK